MKKFLVLTAMAAVTAFSLAGCVERVEDTPAPAPGVEAPAPAPGGDATTPAPTGDNGAEADAPAVSAAANPLAAMQNALAQFPEHFDNGGQHVEGTTFRYGILAPSPIPGNFGGAIFSDAVVDGWVMNLLGTNRSLLNITPQFTFGQDGVATWEYDLDANTFTIHMQHDALWHDGMPVTLEDLVFTYYTLANPDYMGIRFSTYERMVVGIMDFHNGYTDTIEGLVLSNNGRTLTMHMESMSPSMLYNGIWTSPMPKHIFENIPVADMATHPAVLVEPLGWGPFKIQNIVPGESVHLTRFVDHVWGAPYIEEVIMERISDASLVPISMETGQFDFIQFPTVYFEDFQNPTNFSYLGSPTGQYGYVAFRLGHWDFDEGVNVFSPERAMNNVYLRRAMAHAVDFTLLGQELHSGLRFAAGSYMPAHHSALMDTSLPGFPYNPDYANQILDNAGFTMGANGFRTWPDGSDLTVIWALGQDPATEHIIVPFHQQSWAAIGVNVELWQGRTHDQNVLWDTLDYDTDNDEIHIYSARWNPGANPNPSGRWGHAMWNPSRYTSPEYDRLLEQLSDPRAFDADFMRNAYFELQAYLQANVPYFKTLWEINLSAVNNRVANWDTRTGQASNINNMHLVRLTEAEPVSR